MGAKAAALNPQITHQVIPQTGHFPMLEEPQQYLDLVYEFMAIGQPINQPISQ